jgi:calcineurin-like phosphoesterase family protein
MLGVSLRANALVARFAIRVAATFAVLAGVSSVGASSAAASDPVSGDPVIVAAGDVACSPHDPQFNGGAGRTKCRMLATSNLFVGDATVDNVLALGDLQYECGNYNDFLASYALSWGRAKAITYPAIGNHEYQPTDPYGFSCPGDGSGYFQYFGSRAGPSGGYYSWNIGTWHMVVLNSNCKFVSCTANSAQATWLTNDLNANSAQCTLAYWHHPRFNGKTNGPIGQMGAMWNLLYSHGADVILNGHKHAYARFTPLTPSGVTDPTNGIRQFIVGTGGKNIGVVPNTFAMVEKNDPAKHYGVLRMILHPTSYDWQFIATDHTIIDSGTATDYRCH